MPNTVLSTKNSKNRTQSNERPKQPSPQPHHHAVSAPKRDVLEESESVSCSVVSTLCDPMDCGPPGSSVHGISLAKILDWVAISFSRGSSRPRDRTAGLLNYRKILLQSEPLGNILEEKCYLRRQLVASVPK